MLTWVTQKFTTLSHELTYCDWCIIVLSMKSLYSPSGSDVSQINYNLTPQQFNKKKYKLKMKKLL